MISRLEIARLYLFLRETKQQNRGLRVEAIQHWSQGQYGDSWCAEFLTMVLDLEFQGESPIPRMGNCQEIRELCEQQGRIRPDGEAPEPGDLFFYVNDENHAHHIGIYSDADTDSHPIGIAGNTDETGTSNNGDRVAEHRLYNGRLVYAKLEAAA